MINSISCTYEAHTPNKSRRPNGITPRICHRGSHLRLKSTWRIQGSRLLKKARQSAVATFHRPKKLISRPAKQQYFSGLYSEVDTSLLPLKYSCLVTASTHHSDHWDRRQSNSDTRDNANCYTTALHNESAPARQPLQDSAHWELCLFVPSENLPDACKFQLHSRRPREHPPHPIRKYNTLHPCGAQATARNWGSLPPSLSRGIRAVV